MTTRICPHCHAALDPGEICDCTFLSVELFEEAIRTASSLPELERAIKAAEDRQKKISFYLGAEAAEREWEALEDLMASANQKKTELEEKKYDKSKKAV